MNTIVSEEEVKTRKDHRCFGCNDKFPKGSHLTRVTVRGDDGLQSSYWCAPCDAFWDTLDRESTEDGIYQGEIWNFDKYRAFRDNFNSKLESK